MTPLTPAAVMDEQRLKEIDEGNVPEQRAIDELVAEVRRLRERQEDDTVLLGTIAGERDAALAERDAARAALQAVEWTSLDPFFIETPQCPWCLSYEKEGHTTDCQCQAALGRGEGQ